MIDTKQIQTASGINIAAAIWIIFSPFILGFSAINAILVNNILLGIIIGVLAAIRVSMPGKKTNWLSVANMILGLWLIISPFTVSGSMDAAPIWNNVIVGLVVTVMAAWSASTGQETSRV
ncbi:hypothetical protein A2303_01925 [Candidatus Falkowbacteria bacterium RIFOXYB2_FULL_47_14]|uniref:SPW repeat-containing integral membrane domain-containing protein n=1 Tax=Candidatus Falkowbacteria bacterium RIFOXYA2_FULL_47_19 TaxID=1797994 RepID=A0A1F5SPM2_9BACT|nr:MAG: hypothetical protein A2227_06765 [Candidatus Falkowbacteria bacterium RIFOXYA2_FULL_47_19]OGF34593.1 MAG: hypothetical protein A2468_07825 [Candidatus Falkowbacteria bacterium RIFOXYC2_FULL_46_15]OGF43211.1 MAG: hypothetical protein A2303_01925 [Candidatus Falkowbacteria bacterium RIFOXYB2_FULL_47_14]